MSQARHRVTIRGAARTELGKIAGLVALSTIVTATAVGVGVTATGSAGDAVLAQPSSHAGAAIGTIDLDRPVKPREQRVSRTAKRVTLEPEPTDAKFATAPLNVWTAPREQGRRVGLIEWGSKIAVTGQVVGHWSEVLLEKDAVRWVNNDYLANSKPKPEPEPEPEAPSNGSDGASTSESSGVSTGISTAPCAHGSGPEAGLTPDAVEVYRAVCNVFTDVSSYGGYSPRGEHYDGRAVDIMVSGSYGQQIADWLRANAASLQIRDIIYSQRIWTPDRAAEGWRFMEDRGSPTANHYDHVHVAVY